MPPGTGPVAGTQAHAVQFYGGEDELARTVGGYLADALADGATAIVVATPGHRQAFEAWLAAAGTDVASARASGSYAALDAGSLVRRFLVGERPDPALFDAAVGTVIRQAAGSGRPVCVYGEMVALLWDEGQVNAALELEGLWNRLHRELAFSLLCGYPAQSVTRASHHAAFAEVCRLHAAVVGGEPAAALAPAGTMQATRTFPQARQAPRAARRFVTETLLQWEAAELVDDAAIVVTELATNAVVHALSGFTVAISSAGGSLRIWVRDDTPLHGGYGSIPLPAAPGHGLGVVAAVASQWRAEPADGGKAVWADLGSSRAGPGAPGRIP